MSRTWRDRAARNDPAAWYDVDGVWPTPRGTYESCHFLAGTNYAATGAGDPTYAFAARTLSSRREYVVDDSAKIWQWSAGLTDRTGGVTVGAAPMMVQYGDVTIGTMGSANATVKSTGANFSALAGAPNGEIVITVANAVLVFNTNTSADGWHASDVGDYTNWSTGESASGRLIQTPGAVTAAVAFGNDALVFKAGSIYRGRYVGGAVKWAFEVVHVGIGIAFIGGTGTASKYSVAAGTHCILFCTNYDWKTADPQGATSFVYTYTGVGVPTLVNSDTTVIEGSVAYNSQTDTFAVFTGNFSAKKLFWYCAKTGAWGKFTTALTGTIAASVMGEFSARLGGGSTHEQSNMPVLYEKTDADNLKRWEHSSPPGGTAGTCYVQTAMMGSSAKKTLFTRVIPQLRRRRDLGTDSATLQATFWRELEDTSASSTQNNIAESSTRKRFDFSGSDNFARFKITYAALDIEIDDVIVVGQDAGTD